MINLVHQTVLRQLETAFLSKTILNVDVDDSQLLANPFSSFLMRERLVKVVYTLIKTLERSSLHFQTNSRENKVLCNLRQNFSKVV